MIKAIFVVVVTAATAVAPEPRQADLTWVAEGGFCEPETVLPLPDDTLLVSNVCNFRETGNGFLTLLSAGGLSIDWRIVDGLDAPLGMAIVGDRLHVVDNNQVKIFHWPGYELLATVELDTKVANDIAVAAADHEVVVAAAIVPQAVMMLVDGDATLLHPIGDSGHSVAEVDFVLAQFEPRHRR